MKKFVLIGAMALAAVAFGQVTAVLQTGDFEAYVDSIKFRASAGGRTVPTPDFGGSPSTEDTFRFLPSVPWPDQGATVFYTLEGSARNPLDIPSVREDEYYELPGFDGPTQLKFLRGGAVGEGGRTALPVRVSVAPNPLVTSSAVRLAVRRAGDLLVEVFDGTGQVVRVLSSGRAEPGNVVLNWDGADSAGTRVSTGVYFVRVALNGSRALAKVVVTE